MIRGIKVIYYSMILLLDIAGVTIVLERKQGYQGKYLTIGYRFIKVTVFKMSPGVCMRSPVKAAKA